MVATASAPKSLETAIKEAKGPVNLLRNSPLGPYQFPAIPLEFTNWRDEVRAWKNSCALLEQSYHMDELHLRGAKIIPFLSELAVNKFDPFPVLRAKQLVIAGHDGYYLGDSIIFREAEDFVRVVGSQFTLDWLAFNIEKGGYDVEAKRDESFNTRSSGTRDVYRVQVQGPNAVPLMREVTGGSLPDIKFFHVAELKIAGKTVRALRHGMAGELGFEIYGPWDDQKTVREALEKTGEKYGMRKIGAHAYSTNCTESGWVPLPVPAIYHTEKMKPFREWLKAFSLEGLVSLGGSFVSNDITDYYCDPIELGYKGLIDFNRDFIGRDALRERAKAPRRTKVTLELSDEDVLAVIKDSLFPGKGAPAKFLSMPTQLYATFQYDAIMKNGNVAGISLWPIYSANANKFLSLSIVDVEHAQPGTEVTLLWGEPNSQRKAVEKHQVREIRAKVAPAPYFEKVIKTTSK